MSDRNDDRNSSNDRSQSPQDKPLIKGDVPDFEYTPPPPPPPKTDKESE